LSDPSFCVACATCSKAHDSAASFQISTDRKVKSVCGQYEMDARQTLYYCSETCREQAQAAAGVDGEVVGPAPARTGL
jgi:hypothetical protein